MNIIKNPSAAGAVTLASFAASATHIFSVVAETNSALVSWVYPIGIDGLIFVGLRAMQTGRKTVGAIALLIGAAYSLLFNADAEGAIKMDPMLIAASMPICFFAAVLIETTAKKAEEIPAPAPAPQIITKTVAPALLPIAPLAPKAVAPKPVAKALPAIETKKDETRTQAGTGRVAKWDVEKAVRLLADGRTDVEILSLVDGLTAKPWQRTKRAVKIMQADASTPDATIAETVGQSAAHIARIRAAIKE